MKALILAAGRGTRLNGDGDESKCLTTVGGRALLDHYLDVLHALHVDTTIVVGHGAERIRAHVATRARSDHAGSATEPALVLNAHYMQGSVVSLYTGLCAMGVDRSDDVLLLLDGDVAFTPSLLERLATSDASNALLVDIGTVFTDEQYMAGINAGRVLALRRGPVDGHEQQGEWVGFARLAPAMARDFCAAAGEQVARSDTGGGYEDALARLLTTHEVTAVPTEGAPWVEIDFAADLARARELFG